MEFPSQKKMMIAGVEMIDAQLTVGNVSTDLTNQSTSEQKLRLAQSSCINQYQNTNVWTPMRDNKTDRTTANGTESTQPRTRLD